MNEKPSFEQYMLENGMNDLRGLTPAELAKWRAKYALGFPPEPPHEPAPANPAPDVNHESP